MNGFDVRIHAMRRRSDRPRRPFEVRWHAAGRARSRSFATRALADSYRAELVRAARQGLEFSPGTGEPALWATQKLPGATWLEHAVSYAAVKWPHHACPDLRLRHRCEDFSAYSPEFPGCQPDVRSAGARLTFRVRPSASRGVACLILNVLSHIQAAISWH